MRYLKIGLVGLMVVTAAFVTLQNPDLAGNIDGTGSVVAGIGVNVARTGAAVDRSGYASAAMMVVDGHVTNGAGAIVYWVLQDSSLSPAQVWTSQDSVLADTVDNKVFKLGYRLTRRFLRVIQRATTASSDTTLSAGFILLGNKRAR